MADSSESTVMARERAWKRPPVKARASLVRVATSELIEAISERTVVAVRLLMVGVGAADVKEMARRETRMVLMSCILKVDGGAELEGISGL